MNGYNLLRDWYNFKFSNPSKVKAIHSDMYCYLIDLWNRLGQKDEFGLPTQVTMEALGIGSYNTYKKTFDDLLQFGFVELIADSKNQHQSRIIALSKNDKANDKAPDKALDKAHVKATDIINKQETIQQQTTIDYEFYFDLFWNAYDKKRGREKSFKAFKKIDSNLYDLIIDKATQYAQTTPDIKFRKDPLTWLNGKHWEDETVNNLKTINNEGFTAITTELRKRFPNL